MNKLYHPISNEIIDYEQLDDASAFIEDRLFQPGSWKTFYVGEDDKDNLTFGIEIELNTKSMKQKDRIETSKQLLKVLNRDGRHFHIMRDNSVRNGIEIVSAPMTYKYWTTMFDANEINELFEAQGLSATIDTGLHIHVGIKHTRRLRELFVQLFAISYPMWVFMADRRVLRLQERYVSTEYFYKKEEFQTRYDKTLTALIKNGTSKVNYKGLEYYDYPFNDRYTGLNFFNESTVEFRMFSGTDNFNEILNYLNLVNVTCELVVEISDTRVNDVYNLDTFVTRTQSQEILDKTVRHLRFVNSQDNKKRIYYNEFLHLDSHWYQIPMKHVKRKDFALHKQVYEEYLYLLKQLSTNIRYPESRSIQNDINKLLVNNLMEVTRSNGEIFLVGLRSETYPHVIEKDEIKDFIFLRGVNSSFIKDSH